MHQQIPVKIEERIEVKGVAIEMEEEREIERKRKSEVTRKEAYIERAPERAGDESWKMRHIRMG